MKGKRPITQTEKCKWLNANKRRIAGMRPDHVFYLMQRDGVYSMRTAKRDALPALEKLINLVFK